MRRDRLLDDAGVAGEVYSVVGAELTESGQRVGVAAGGDYTVRAEVLRDLNGDLRMSRVPWNFGGGPVSIRLRSRVDHGSRR